MTNLNYLILIENIDETHVYNGKVFNTHKQVKFVYENLEESMPFNTIIRLVELDLLAAYTRVIQTTTGSKK